MAVSMDELLRLLGQPGRYQIIICVMMYYNYLQLPLNNLSMAFFGAAPLGYRCGLTGDTTGNSSMYSAYETTDGGKCLKYRTSNVDVSTWCAVRENCTSCNASTPFYMEEREWTIVAQFDLVCDRNYLNNLASTIYFLGVMVGSLVFGYFADTFGRLPILVSTLYLSTAVGIGLFFTDTYALFAVLRFMMGFLIQGHQIALLPLVLEYFTTKARGIVLCILEVFFGLGVFMLSLLAFLIRDWRWIQLCISLSTILTVFVVWLYPESLRWLLVKGKYRQAEQMIKKIFRYNGQKEVPKEVWTFLEEQKKSSGKQPKLYNIFHLLQNRTLRIRSIILWYIWFSSYLGYYGLILSTGSLPGHKYTTFLVGTGVELVTYVINIALLYFLGRRLPLAVYLLVGGAASIVTSFIEDPIAMTILAVVARLGVGNGVSIMFLYVAELYPTSMRGAGLGSGTFWLNAGGLVAPQVNLLGTIAYPGLPFIIFGVLSIGAAVSVLFLPETLNKKLPDTVEEAEGMGWGCCIGDDHKETVGEKSAMTIETTKL